MIQYPGAEVGSDDGTVFGQASLMLEQLCTSDGPTSRVLLDMRCTGPVMVYFFVLLHWTDTSAVLPVFF